MPADLTRAAVQKQIETILASRHFVSAERLGRFLRFVSSKALDGQDAQIKESVIGVEVFDRSATSFDPGSDPIVRVQARRLRAKLAEYYQAEGVDDVLLVELPRGHYIPSFRTHDDSDVAAADGARDRSGFGNAASVAVLPFLNMSSDPENEYFSDGLTEELIHVLAGIPSLRVVARTSAFQFKGKQVDVGEIGRILGVSKIIEGSVRKADGTLRITAQLIDVADGGHLWSARYDRTMTDVFALQDEVAGAIRQALSAHLTAPPRHASALHPTENVDAFNHYLMGRHHWNKRSERGFRTALRHFGEAIQLDAGYGRAYSGLADCYLMLGMSAAEAPKDCMNLARAAAQQALAIDDRLVEAHTSLAGVMVNFDWDWPSAEVEFRRALDLDPSYATLHHWQALFFFAHRGQFNEAAAAIHRAVALDPLSLPINLDIALIELLRGNYDEVITQCANVLDLDPNYDRAHWFTGMALEQQGDFEAATEELQKALTLGSGGYAFRSRILGALGHAFGRWGKIEEARAILDEMHALARDRYVDKFEIATVYAGLGETEEAMNYFQQAAMERSAHMGTLGVWPGLDHLHSNPQFKVLLSLLNTGLETEQSAAEAL